MATVRQIEANRRNAQKSTGPSTLEGKSRSSWNALKSGVYAESEILPGEDPSQLDQLQAEYHDYHQPVTAEHRALVDSLVRNEWLLRRFAAIESDMFASGPRAEGPIETHIAHRFDACLKALELLQRRINAAERNFHRSLQALRQLESLAPRQASEFTTTSENLASFPEIAAPPARLPQDPAPGPEISAHPEPQSPSAPAAKLASFPQLAGAPSPRPRILPLPSLSSAPQATGLGRLTSAVAASYNSMRIDVCDVPVRGRK